MAPARRLPAPQKPIPVSTYRLQLSEAFTLDDAAAQVDYFSALGVSHLYLSPILQAAPGSTHGYDVVDHSCISVELGGRAAFERLAAAAHADGLHLILDLVPNHMAVPTPLWHNRALWSVLSLGAESPFAHWFDVDWSAGNGALLMPILGERIGRALADDRFSVDHVTPSGASKPEPALRYYEHVLPLAARYREPADGGTAGASALSAGLVGRWPMKNSTTGASSTLTHWSRFASRIRRCSMQPMT